MSNQSIRQWAAHGLQTRALDDLEEMLERDAFDAWKSCEEENMHDARMRYIGAASVIQTLRNLAAE